MAKKASKKKPAPAKKAAVKKPRKKQAPMPMEYRRRKLYKKCKTKWCDARVHPQSKTGLCRECWDCRYLPTPTQIAKEMEDIKMEWSPQEMRSREVNGTLRWRVPQVKCYLEDYVRKHVREDGGGSEMKDECYRRD